MPRHRILGPLDGEYFSAVATVREGARRDESNEAVREGRRLIGLASYFRNLFDGAVQDHEEAVLAAEAAKAEK